jgi:hypothetical protein
LECFRVSVKQTVRYTRMLEATGGFEPPMEVLQTSALTTWLRRLMYLLVPRAGFEPTQAMPTAPSRQRVYQFHHLGMVTTMKVNVPLSLVLTLRRYELANDIQG